MGHGDPIAAVGLSLAIIVIVAKFGGDVAMRLGQPAILGELVFGVVLRNLTLLDVFGFERMKSDVFIDMLARIGMLILTV